MLSPDNRLADTQLIVLVSGSYMAWYPGPHDVSRQLSISLSVLVFLANHDINVSLSLLSMILIWLCASGRRKSADGAASQLPQILSARRHVRHLSVFKRVYSSLAVSYPQSFAQISYMQLSLSALVMHDESFGVTAISRSGPYRTS